MSATPNAKTTAWSADVLYETLSHQYDEGVRVLALCGLGAHHFESVQADVARQLARHDYLLLVLDPTGNVSSTQTWLQCLDHYIQEVDRRGGLSESMEELISWLHTTQRGVEQVQHHHSGIYQSTDVIGRLWQMLSEVIPAVLIIVHAEQLDEHVRDQLCDMAADYFHDPIAQLMPEYQTQTAQQGMMVVMTHERQRPQWLDELEHFGMVDMYHHIESDVRAYLSRRDVVARVMQTTHGNIHQLDQLIDELDENIQHLSMHRYTRMSEHEQLMLQVLALSSVPLPMRLLMQAMSTLGSKVPLAQSVKSLIQRGDLTRHIKLGDVLLSLGDRTFGQSIAMQMDEAHRQRLHDVLSQVASKEGGDTWQIVATKHALWAGAAVQIRRDGLQAVRHLFVQGEFQQALTLLNGVLAYLEDDDVQHTTALAFKVELCARLGNWRRAIEASCALESLVSVDRGLAQLLYRRARLWTRINEHDQAAECLARALDALGDGARDVLRAQLMLAQGECFYELGQHEQAQQWALSSMQYLDALDGFGESELTRVRIDARNLLGKVAIFFTQYDQARERFEENLEDAQLWGLSVETARAQGNMGVVAMQQALYDEAHHYLTLALSATDTPDALPRARCLLNLGFIHQHRFEYELALRNYLDAMRVSKQKEQLRTYSIATYNVATLYRDLGAFDRAERMLEHINKAVNASSRHPFVTRWYESLMANIYLRQGRHEDIIALLSYLENQTSQHQDVIYGESSKRLRLAEAYLATGRWERARELIEGIEQEKLEADNKLLAHQLTLRARVALMQDDPAQAEALAIEAKPMWEQIGQFYDALSNDLAHALAVEAQNRQAQAKVLFGALGECILAHARKLPARFRSGFFTVTLHREVAAHIARVGLDVPRELTSAPELVSVPQHSAAWQQWRERYAKIVGESERLHQIFRVLDRVAASQTPLLVLGESGTGKELIAQATHELSERANKPFVRVNCAAFVDSLLLSELFGHEKGAFTGAVSQKVGRFEMANGGTLFLDEIADISPQTQVALLRVLQESEFERVGGTQTIRVNVRLVCATNKNLEEMVQRGEFRLDLYYRLKGMIIDVPALRERREDIPRLVEHFAHDASVPENNKRFAPEVLRYLMRYSWPGNIRELQNFVRSVLLFVEGDVVERHHLREFEDFFSDGEFIKHAPPLEDIWQTPQTSLEEPSAPVVFMPVEQQDSTPKHSGDPEEALINRILSQDLTLNEIKQRLELESIRRALIQTDGNVTQAAKILQMKRPRLSQIINGTPELSTLKEQLTA